MAADVLDRLRRERPAAEPADAGDPAGAGALFAQIVAVPRAASRPRTAPFSRRRLARVLLAAFAILAPLAIAARTTHVLDCVANELLGHGADEDLAVIGRLLESLRRVHGVSRDEGRHLVAGNDHAGVDPDPDLDPEPRIRGVELVDRLEEAKASPDGALGVVLVRDRRAEDRHHGVADELL